MTSDEAPAWLRAKVLEQIDSTPVSQWASVPRWTWVGTAALLVLAVASSVWVWRPQPATGPVQAVASSGANEPAMAQLQTTDPPPQMALADSTEAKPAGDIGTAPTARRQARATQEAAEPVAATDAAEGELEPWILVEPLPEADPIAIEQVSIAPLEITTLTIPELRVDPVDPGRDPNKL